MHAPPDRRERSSRHPHHRHRGQRSSAASTASASFSPTRSRSRRSCGRATRSPSRCFLPPCRRRAGQALFRTAHPGLQILRGLTPLTVSAGMVLGVRYLPLAERRRSSSPGRSSWSASSAPLLGERVAPASWIGVTAGFFGDPASSRGRASATLRLHGLSAGRGGLLRVPAACHATARAARRTADDDARLDAARRQRSRRRRSPSPPGLPLSATAWLYMIGLGMVFGVAQLLLIRAFAHAPASVARALQLLSRSSRPSVFGLARLRRRAGFLDARRHCRDHRPPASM